MTDVHSSYGGVPAGQAVPQAKSPSRPSGASRLLGALIDAALISALLFVLFIGFGLVGNRWYNIIGVDGGSMEPAISRGDLIVVMPPPARIEIGMVLVMTVGIEHVTHRVVGVNADGTFATRGDANTVNDDWSGQPVAVNGLSVASIPWLGTILPVRNATGAFFADALRATMDITVGPFPPPVPPPTPPDCLGMKFAQVLVGTSGDDVINAGNGGALVFGLGGNDTITGGNGKDCLVGGDGNDVLFGGNGKDVLLGGEGNDTLHGGGDDDLIEAGHGKDRLDGGDGTDICYGTSKDSLQGCETIIGSGANPPPLPINPIPAATPGPGIGTAPPTAAPTPASPGPDPAPTAIVAATAPPPTAVPTPTPAATVPNPTAPPVPSSPPAVPAPDPAPTPASTP